MRDVFFWTSITFFIVGVALFSVSSLGLPFVFFAVALAGALLLLSLTLTYRRAAAVAAVALLALAGGAARMHAAQETLPDPALDAFIGREVVIEGVVMREPDVRERTVRIHVHAKTVSSQDTPPASADAGVLSIVRLPFDVSYGDIIRMRGKLSLPKPFETDTGRTFDYVHYLAKEGIAYEVPFPEVEIVGRGGASIRGSLYALKRRFLEGLGAALPEPHASLAGGITVGDRRSLGDDLLAQFRDTGIIHIIVLSGYNLTIISDSILRTLAHAPQSLGLGIGAIAIVLFAIMTGASASIVRASVMAILAMLARATHRRYAIVRALALATVGMVLWEPFILIYDPGFQLSVLATIGLIYVAPLVEEYMPWVPKSFGLRAIVGATVGTQICVLPLLLYQTGSVSVVALPVNLLVLIVMPYAMFFSFLAGTLGGLVGAYAAIVAAPAYALLSWTLAVTKLFGSIPFASYAIGAFSLWWVGAAYALLGGVLVYTYRNGRVNDLVRARTDLPRYSNSDF